MLNVFHTFTQRSDPEQQEGEAQEAPEQRAAQREQQRRREAAQRRAFAEQERARKACKRAEEERRWRVYRHQRARERRSAEQEHQQRREQARAGRTQPGAGGALCAKGTTQAERDAYYGHILTLDVEALTPEAVRKSYRRLAAGYHPDKVAHLGKKLQEVAAAETRKLNEARTYFRRRFNF